ncbi:hypothetical protein BURCENK562V_C2582 [Burkholderia cenocepacia K56-2Valvano]|nr:hypothetical protein BURCENK562V_C2582 [Burkholderia cenocepacia K56-2Valvano]
MPDSIEKFNVSGECDRRVPVELVAAPRRRVDGFAARCAV